MTDLDPWQALHRFTAARIGLGHSGASQPTRAQLDFQLGHARARDAVHGALDTAQLGAALAPAWPAAPCPLLLHSAAADRNIYLQRPDLGRQLDAASRQLLRARHGGAVNEDRYDLSVVVADGLSALAIMRHAAPLLQALHARLEALAWPLAPVAIVQQGRVAVGDEVGELLGAKIVLVLIGERPGLSSPDSMGLYLTWAPRVGLTDERRNCISNVRPAGLCIEDAAARLHYLLAEAHRRQLSGVHLKDDSTVAARRLGGDVGSFLL
ncbi:ethanolamine ammonia-lyase subunit EutC [Massilia sp. IC2-278]|uniref:ethanolamine ammonia-lyase subunit EutC n=1 Tax=Massilia sp. IC2-278 TaxID=2887200 RepID=UPI001E4247A1|nr:ethanolamine ammonia-lyase subunit EutC [Massilia sp. IC2-278]MCC2962706.1 ethanolamine ammonia-lyase subunit EutC [Massilia sp. IC2-278]